jgi:hypothetical protein
MLHMLTPIRLLAGCTAASLAFPAPIGPQTLASSAAATPRIVLESADGTSQTRDARGFDTRDPRQLGARIVRFEGGSASLAAPSFDDSGVLELADGDPLFGRVRGGRAELLDVEVAGPVHVGVSVDELKSLTFPARVPPAWTAPLAAPSEGDRLYRRQGEGLDRVDGGVEEFTAEGVRFRGTLGSKMIAWSDVAALFIEGLARTPNRAAAGKPDAPAPVVVDLVDHSRLRGTLKRLTGDECRLIARSGAELVIPAAALAELTVDDGAIAFLSALAPSSAVDSAPFGDALGMRWPHRVDRSVTGAPLSAGGRVFMRGIGVHAPSKLAWKLDGGWKTLRGSVAIDDQVLRLAARGSVVFRVSVDGKKRWESTALHGGDAPLAMPPQDLSGAHELELEVTMADDTCVADRADWLDMILARG